MTTTNISKLPADFDENPEWTEENWKRAVRIDGLPESLQRILKSGRGAQKAPTKVPVSIRLSQDVADALRATGAGWQGRVDEALRAWLKLSAR